jgi:hypothetical protein
MVRVWWLLVVAGLLAISGFGFQGYTAYTTIARVDATSKIVTPSPVLLFPDVATNGPRVGATIDPSNRATYTKALEQFLLGGTGLCLGLTVSLAGLFVRANQ